MEKIASCCLKAMGWTVNEFRPPEKKYVLIVVTEKQLKMLKKHLV